ncbi:MAG TPA: ANTAR domain-containing protein [Bryobacteraceae bacterium]|nr:ANTAR domain-containing protein [Bryobacteraceae bacterium]
MNATTVRHIDTHFPAPLPDGPQAPDYRGIETILQSTLQQVDAEGLYLHRLRPETARAHLVAFAGPPAEEFAAPAGEHLARKTPIVLQADAWRDARLARFPEFAAHKFKGAVSIPAVESGITIGILNVCRRSGLPLKPGELALLLQLSLPLGALLTAAETNQALRTEVGRLGRQLADRKIIERAKGLLQSRFEWTEEQAYGHLHRTCHRRRVAMREVALEVIENGGLHLLGEVAGAE